MRNSILSLLMAIMCCSNVSVQAQNDIDSSWFDVTLRSLLFVKSDSEIHFVPNARDPEAKNGNQIFKFNDASKDRVFAEIKKAVGNRRINVMPNPSVSTDLFCDVVSLFSEPSYALKFVETTGGAASEDWPEGVDRVAIMKENKRNMAQLRKAFEKQKAVRIAERNTENQNDGLRSTLFVKSNQEVHFVPNGHDPTLKQTQEFKFDEDSRRTVLQQVKKAVGNRRIDISPNPDVSVKLIAELTKIFADSKYDLKFGNLYQDFDRDGLGLDANTRDKIQRKISQLEYEFDKQVSENSKQSLRRKFARLFDDRQELQIRKIDAQIVQLQELKAKIQKRGERKHQAVDAMLEAFLLESFLHEPKASASNRR